MGKNTSVKKKAATKRVASKKTTRKSTASGKLSTKAVHGIAQLHTAKVHGGSYLTTSAFKGIVKDLDVGIPIWSGALHMSAATLEKRMEKNTAFHPLEEDRLLAVQQVLERGMEVFEDADDLEEWLKAKHALLQNQRPMDLLGSTPGIGLVMLELGRIEHGIYWMLLYRLGKTKHAHKLDGLGARDYPGRWNSFGNAMVYASESSSTTVLEVRVHAKKLRRNLALTTIEVPDTASVLTIKAKDLPHGWQWMRYLARVRAVGDEFLKARKHLMLRVPSAVDPKAWNCLLNPAHPDMAKVKVVKVEPYGLDPRLFDVK